MRYYYTRIFSLVALLLTLTVVQSSAQNPNPFGLVKWSRLGNGGSGFGNPILGDDQLGMDVAVIGDLDGDGVPDMAIGSPFYDGNNTDQGAVYVCTMNADRTVKNRNIIEINGTSRFGYSVKGIGDLNGDGVPDIVVGAIGESNSKGAVYICFLKSNGTLLSYKKITGGTTNFVSSLSNNAMFGFAVEKLGDLNGDGVMDIAVGTPGLSDNGTTRGGVYIIFLKNSGDVASYSVISDALSNTFNGNLSNGDNFGSSIANIGDIDGDGVVDIAVGARGLDDGASDAGGFFIIRLTTAGINKRDTKVSSSTSATIKNIAGFAGQNFGSSLALIPKFSIPGSAITMMVGASGDDDGYTDAGAVYLIGFDTGFAVKAYQKLSNTNSRFKNVLNSGSAFGKSMAYFGNSDSGNYHYIYIGAPGYDPGVTMAGTTFYIKFRQTDIALSSILIPSDTVCGNTTVNFKVVLKNVNGRADVNEIPVRVRSKGVNNFVTRDTLVRNPMGAWNTDTFTFKNTTTFNTSGSDSLFFKVSMFGDFSLSNDSLVKRVFTAPSLTKPNFGRDTTLCEGEMYKLDLGNPGAKYKWSNGDTSRVIYVASGATIWGVARIGQCMVSDTIVINYHQTLKVDLGKDTVLCAGQTLILDAGNPGRRHLWSNGDTGRTTRIFTPGRYVATVYYNRCVFRDTIVVSFVSVAANLGRDTTLCEGEQYTLDAGNPGAKYIWNTGDTSRRITVSKTGKYYVKVYINQCESVDTAQVTFLPFPKVNLGRDTLLCGGQTITLDAGNNTPGSTYLWSTGARTQTITVSAAGKYSVTVTNKKCAARDTVEVKYTSVRANLGRDTTLCAGDKYVLFANNYNDNAQFLWNTGDTTPTITVKDPGTYYVTVRSAQCVASDTAIVNFLPIDSVDLGPDQIICVGESITLDAGPTGTGTYLWSTGETTRFITATKPGTYKATIFNGKCAASDVVVLRTETFEEPLTRNDTTRCEGESITLDARNAGARYLWSTGDTTRNITITDNGIYSVTVMKGKCAITDSIRAFFIPAPVIELGNDTMLCYGSTITLDAGAPGADNTRYLWSNGQRTRTITVKKPGTYSVEVSNGRCASSNSVNIGFYDALRHELKPEVYLCGDNSGSVRLTAGEASNYQWYPGGQTSRSINVNEPGVYRVVMTHPSGCRIVDSSEVFECPAPEVFMPTAFTPDGDNVNDTYKPLNQNFTQYSFVIINRWGQKIFISNDPTQGWDGTYNGKPVPDGVYAWTLVYRIKTSDGTPAQKIMSGNVTLLRH